MGPLLFLIYINDLHDNLVSSTKLFADDTSIFSIIKEIELSFSNLNKDLSLIKNWAFRWKMSFGLKLLTRLRVGLSHLKEHKYRHNFVDTLVPLCNCGLMESQNITHFLLRCNFYPNLRKTLLDSIIKLIESLRFSDTTRNCNELYGIFQGYSDHDNGNFKKFMFIFTFFLDLGKEEKKKKKRKITLTI